MQNKCSALNIGAILIINVNPLFGVWNIMHIHGIKGHKSILTVASSSSLTQVYFEEVLLEV